MTARALRKNYWRMHLFECHARGGSRLTWRSAAVTWLPRRFIRVLALKPPASAAIIIKITARMPY